MINNLLVESFLDVGHSFKVGGHIRTVLGGVLNFVLSCQIIQ